MNRHIPMSLHDQEDDKLRILVVDNNLPFRETLVDLLRGFGYDPIAAHGVGAELEQDAVKLAQSQQCHLALIDIRLDQLPSGLEGGARGLDIVSTIRPTETIILTGYQDYHSTKRALGKEKVFDIVLKDDEMPEKLASVLRRAQQAYWPTLRLQTTMDFDELMGPLLNRLDEQTRALRSRQIRRLIMRIAHEGHNTQSSEIHITPLAESLETPSLGGQFRANSVVLRIEEAGKNPLILKLAGVERARGEQRHYDQFVDRKLGGGFYPRLRKSDALWTIGASLYELIGSQATHVNTFDQYFDQHQSTDRLTRPLRRFFETVWGEHHLSTTQPLQASSLFDAYNAKWRRPGAPGVLEDALATPRDIVAKTREMEFNYNAVRAWLAQHRAFSLLDDAPPPRQCVVHGDLNARNLLVNDEGYCWAVDFERTGVGHALMDFVELEHDIVTRVIGEEHDVAPEAFYDLVVALIHPTACTDAPAGNAHIIGDLNLTKALQLSITLRQIACRAKLFGDYREYYWGLLFNTVFVLHKLQVLATDRGKSQRRQERTLILADLLCRRLEHWGDAAWRPDDWLAPDTKNRAG